MKRRLAITQLVILVLLFSATPAQAASLKINLAAWSVDAVLNIPAEKAIPSMASVKKSLLYLCKRKLEYGIGTKIRAVNEYGATVGIGKLTSVSIGKVTRGIQNFYGAGEDPISTDTVFVAPCNFKGSISNLRSADFYTFFIGDSYTSEYDSSELRRNKWVLDLIDNRLACSNYEGFDSLNGCDY